MKDSSSPEDKLLSLIRNPKKPPAAQAAKAHGLRAESAFGANIKAETKIRKSGLFVGLRRVFFWLFIASGIYLISNAIYPRLGLKNIRLPKPAERLPPERLSAGLTGKPLEEYLEGVKGRQIFSRTAAAQNNTLINVADSGLMKDISLVGIISGDNPQAVIEDKKAQKTYYVNKGQFIGEMQIEDIQEGKIIIDYGGQKYELYM